MIKRKEQKQMESILSMHDEVYSVKNRRNKSSGYSTNSLQIRRSTLNNTSNLFSIIYQSLRTMFAQRTLYILGIFNLILAAIAILCVTQAEDHPEYFSLVYIAVAIFVFYMITILAIIIVQVIGTYQEQHQTTHCSLATQTPFDLSSMTIPINPLVVESMTTQTHPKTRLSRSHTLPLMSTHSTSTSIWKDFHPLKSARLTFLPRHSHFSRQYHSYLLTTNERLSAS